MYSVDKTAGEAKIFCDACEHCRWYDGDTKNNSVNGVPFNITYLNLLRQLALTAVSHNPDICFSRIPIPLLIRRSFSQRCY